MTITRNFSVLANGAGSANTLSLGGATLGSNALAVTGTTNLSSSLTIGGRFTQSLSPVAAEYALRSTGQTTGWIAIDMANTGGDYIIAGENSTGNNLIVGDSAYDMCIRGPSGIAFSANAGATQQMRLTSAGNLGIGIAPSAWNTFTQIVQCPSGSLGGTSATDFRVMANLYYNSGWKAYATGQCSQYQQNAGVHSWNCTPSTAANATPTFTDQLNIYGNTGVYFGDNPANPSSHAGRVHFGGAASGGQVIALGAGVNTVTAPLSMFMNPQGSGFYTQDNSTASNQCWRMINPNGTVGGITVSGSGTTFNTTSDERLKNFDVPQRDFKEIIQTIMVKDGEFLVAPGDRMLMISAQQTAEIGYLDAVEYPQDKKEHDDQPQNIYWSADYARLAPLALWGVKDLYAENEALKATVADLVARLEALEAK